MQFLRHCCLVYIMITLCEIMIYSVLSLFKWTFVCSINENFFFIFISYFNFGIVLITQITRWLMGTLENPLFELISGTLNLNMDSRVFIFWKVFIGIVSVILVIGSIMIGYKKLRNRQKTDVHLAKVQPALPQQNLNNIAQNNPLLNHLHVIIISIIWVCVISTFMISSNNSIKEDDNEFSSMKQILFLEIFTDYFTCILFPAFILSRKSTFRTYLHRELKSFLHLDGFL